MHFQKVAVEVTRYDKQTEKYIESPKCVLV